MDGWERTVPCKDSSGRLRSLRVVVTESGEVGILAPPGEAAVIAPKLVDEVKAYLTSAQLEAVQRRGEW